jgi:AcrR family transcriptional regulator
VPEATPVSICICGGFLQVFKKRPDIAEPDSIRSMRGIIKSGRSKAKPSKRDAILNAMLDVVVERGFHEAPMPLISERSRASAGVIYHYFASKEEIAYHFYRKHLRELRFLDQYESAGFVCLPDQDAQPDKVRTEFERRFSGRSKGGVLNDWPPEVLQELTLGLVARLAKQTKK